MFRLMLATDSRKARMPLSEVARLAAEGGVDAVQLRERDMEAGQLFRLAQELRVVTRDFGAKLIVNHRADIALAVEADGVHLGWRSMGVNDVRRLAGRRLLVGVSCHDERQLRLAEMAGADYALVGPIYATPSKEGLAAPLGIEALRALAGQAKIPLIAIGGIRPDNAGEVRAAGAKGIAVISAIMDAEDPREAARQLLG